MHAVCETPAFVRAAEQAGMTDAEVKGLIDMLAADPMAGVAIAGTGGCRKVRVAGRGKGKSGGYRTITFYSGLRMPVFLLTVFSKGEEDNLTKEERNDLGKITKQIADEYSRKVLKVGGRRP